MKGKVIRGTRFLGLLKYVFGKDKKQKNKDARIIGGNMTGLNPAELNQEFHESNAVGAKKYVRPVLHIPLRMPAGEDVSDGKWVKIIKRVMEEMGLSRNRPWVLVKHPHEHVHLVTTRIDRDGTPWKGHWEGLLLIAATHALEKEFGLTETPTLDRSEWNKINPTDKVPLTSGQIHKKKLQAAQGMVPELTPNEKLAVLIAEAISASNGTFESFSEQLKGKGVSVRRNESITTGHVSGISYLLAGAAKGIKGSKINRDCAWQSILERLEKQKAINSFILDPEPVFDFSAETPPVPPPPRSKKTSTPPEPESKIDDPIKIRTSPEVVIERVYTPEAVWVAKPEKQRSLDDIPAHIAWKPNDNAWDHLLDSLIREYRLRRKLLEELKEKKDLWAINSHTLATASRNPDTNEIVGITRMQIGSGPLTPEVLLPNQRGLFSIGAPFAEAEKFVVTANPIEAISYLRLKQLKTGEYSKGIHVVSTDGLPPPDWWLERVYEAVAGKIQSKPDDSWGPVIATHESRDAIMTPPALRPFFPGANDFHQFLGVEVVDVAMIQNASPAEKSTIWQTELKTYLSEVQTREREQVEEK